VSEKPATNHLWQFWKTCTPDEQDEFLKRYVMDVGVDYGIRKFLMITNRVCMRNKLLECRNREQAMCEGCPRADRWDAFGNCDGL
jgi:hypothetical protein